VIRSATLDDLPILVAQSAAIAGGDRRDAAWFTARQHLVLEVDGVMAGHTSWTTHASPVRFVTWDETYVAPEYRQRGHGWALMDARAQRTPGLVFGACKPDNEPMVHLLLKFGFHPCQTIPNAYSDGDAVLWSRHHA
jgi:ribosomal protein S18 acetylase RimI-like enzyme